MSLEGVGWNWEIQSTSLGLQLFRRSAKILTLESLTYLRQITGTKFDTVMWPKRAHAKSGQWYTRLTSSFQSPLRPSKCIHYASNIHLYLLGSKEWQILVQRTPSMEFEQMWRVAMLDLVFSAASTQTDPKPPTKVRSPLWFTGSQLPEPAIPVKIAIHLVGIRVSHRNYTTGMPL